MLERSNFTYARLQMVEKQLIRRGIRDKAVIEAMRQVPREAFVEPGFEEFAYEDGTLPIEKGQTISQPYIVALMIEAAQVRLKDLVLEVGAGSGYATAVLSRAADYVCAIERHPELAKTAHNRLHALGYDNVDIRLGDGTRGWPDAVLFDVILVSAGGPEVPSALKRQLTVGGCLVIPVGSEKNQMLLKLTRENKTEFLPENLGLVHFVPLIGAQGWGENDWFVNGHRQHPQRRMNVRNIMANAAEPLQ